MPDITSLKNTYFVQAADATEPSEPVPASFENCLITPIIDAHDYNAEIEAALGTVGTGEDEAANSQHFIFIANWWLGLEGGNYEPISSVFSLTGPTIAESSQYTLEPPSDSEEPPDNERILINILKQKARAGVDVRVLGWISFAIMDSIIAQRVGVGGMEQINAMTMQSIQSLREEPNLAQKSVLNIICHTAGSIHVKMVVIGNGTDAVGFTGGLDFEEGRYAQAQHTEELNWHDVAAKVEGPAVQALYDHFKNMWNENVSRPAKRFRFENTKMPSFMPGTPTLPDRVMPIAPKGTHHVQSLRTVPAFNYAWNNCLPENPPISFGPSGIFEYKVALKKALENAETYIYMEDQSYWSQEILSWINTAIKQQPDLRVILLFSGSADPNDPDFDDGAILNQSINNGLLEGLTPPQIDQVRAFRRLGPIVIQSRVLHITNVTDEGETSLVSLDQEAVEDIAENFFADKQAKLFQQSDLTNVFDIIGNPPISEGNTMIFRVQNQPESTPPVVDDYLIGEPSGVVVHSKTILVDDNWAVIGSGNAIRRSLYTDLEHGVSFVDQDQVVVQAYRNRLWAEHLLHPTPDELSDIQAALHAWEPAWGAPGIELEQPAPLRSIALPVPNISMTNQKRYDAYVDPDSRQDWGGLCP
ncbi:MAG: hypothetical protein ACPG8W_06255 [Candidatus Promineifilaceae bacterium]